MLHFVFFCLLETNEGNEYQWANELSSECEKIILKKKTSTMIFIEKKKGNQT